MQDDIACVQNSKRIANVCSCGVIALRISNLGDFNARILSIGNNFSIVVFNGISVGIFTCCGYCVDYGTGLNVRLRYGIGRCEIAVFAGKQCTHNFIHAGKRVSHNYVSQRYITGILDMDAVGNNFTHKRQIVNIRHLPDCQDRISGTGDGNRIIVRHIRTIRILTCCHSGINHFTGIDIGLCYHKGSIVSFHSARNQHRNSHIESDFRVSHQNICQGQITGVLYRNRVANNIANCRKNGFIRNFRYRQGRSLGTGHGHGVFIGHIFSVWIFARCSRRIDYFARIKIRLSHHVAVCEGLNRTRRKHRDHCVQTNLGIGYHYIRQNHITCVFHTDRVVNCLANGGNRCDIGCFCHFESRTLRAGHRFRIIIGHVVAVGIFSGNCGNIDNFTSVNIRLSHGITGR